MQRINRHYFCRLANSPEWRAWLQNNHSTIFKSFASSMGHGRSCAESQLIMVSILDKISENPDAENQLVAYLKEHFPAAIDNDYLCTPDPNNIFPNYNPSLLTLPMRRIVDGDATEFINQQAYCETYTYNGLTYIEYIPKHLMQLKDTIPLSNWLIRQFCGKSSPMAVG